MSAPSPTTSKPLAVVTGASSGIGRALAGQFAQHGHDLIVCAEDQSLSAAAEELRRTGSAVRAVRTDLATYEGVEELYAAIRADGRPVAALALNAGVGLGGSFAGDQRLEDALRLVQLDVVGTVHLAHRVISDMRQQGSGRVLFTSSIASMMPGPYQALYNASKSFEQSFAEALADELRGTGVTVTSLMPGPTDTAFFRRAGLLDTKLGTTSAKSDPELVARQGYEALMAGQLRVVGGGLSTKAQAAVLRVLPDKVKAAVHRLQARPGSAA